MTELDIYSNNDPSSIDIEKVSSLYGNRRTVVNAFLKDKLKSMTISDESDISIFELIELQLGYPIPAKIRKQLQESNNQ